MRVVLWPVVLSPCGMFIERWCSVIMSVVFALSETTSALRPARPVWQSGTERQKRNISWCSVKINGFSSFRIHVEMGLNMLRSSWIRYFQLDPRFLSLRTVSFLSSSIQFTWYYPFNFSEFRILSKWKQNFSFQRSIVLRLSSLFELQVSNWTSSNHVILHWSFVPNIFEVIPKLPERWTGSFPSLPDKVMHFSFHRRIFSTLFISFV